MSKYTTGEVAKLCGVTVRTVQYYDSRNILIPSQLSEGGRRLYSEEDLRKMRIICFLREVGLPINTIGQLLSQEHSENVVDLIFQQQENQLRGELQQQQEKLDKLLMLRKELKGMDHFCVESIGDVAIIMQNKKKTHRIRWTMLGVGLLSEAVEITTILLWVLQGIWWPFVFVGLPVMIALSTGISCFYFKNMAYICPECHQVFRPKFWSAFWANHTPTTRKLTCTNCGHRGFCVETYAGK